MWSITIVKPWKVGSIMSVEWIRTKMQWRYLVTAVRHSVVADSTANWNAL